ncbi:metallophosphoesterase [Paraglaciecola sp.]|uniref:metallophosphoesterase n=1 Tax=Paraglaciecola sp. TaxID=1920173 RepID=UPI0030F4459F
MDSIVCMFNHFYRYCAARRTYKLISLLLCCSHLSLSAQDNSNSFSLGIIADCQYANQADNGKRLYTLCPSKLEQAVEDLNTKYPDAVIHLGDFIDQDFDSFDRLLNITQKLKMPIFHVLGNHDFSVEDKFKTQITETLNMPARYYTFDLHEWRFIALDGNDVSTYAWPKDSAQHTKNMALYESEYQGRKRWNGALGDQQLQWLKKQLANATEDKKKVILLSHFPIFPENMHNLWNAESVLAVIRPFNVVKAWFNGHNHDGNYAETEGIHFITFHAMLDTPETAYSLVSFSETKIQIKGQGRQPSMELLIR